MIWARPHDQDHDQVLVVNGQQQRRESGDRPVGLSSQGRESREESPVLLRSEAIREEE